MSLNLNRHGASMQEAWKKVCNEKSDTNWVLFGYEGTSFDLKLISTGEDGVDEMKEDLNASKIMYGFLRLQDPKTSLPKYVFFHWQGESVPGSRKGKAATHLRDIEKYFHGAHLTITARDEDEIDEEIFLDKVSKVSATSYNFKEKQTFGDEAPVGPVGSNHKKINPKAELPNMDDREKFWNSEESKEKERVADEKVRKKSEVKQLDLERRAREERESKLRDAAITERERKISTLKEKEAKIDNIHSEDGKKKWEKQQVEDAKDEESRQKRADELKRQRSQEAKQLIGQRSTEARAVFERHSSQGQFRSKQQTSSSNITNDVIEESKAPISGSGAPISGSDAPISPPVPSAFAAPTPKEDAINANEVSTEDIVVPPPMDFGNDDNRISEIQQQQQQPQQHPQQRPQQPPDVTGAASTPHQPDLIQDVAAKQGPDITSSAIVSEETTKNDNAGDKVNGGSSAEYGLCAMALYDYQAADETEISFDPGQLITHIDEIDPGWWQGLGPDGNYGLFPANYVETVDSSTIRA